MTRKDPNLITQADYAKSRKARGLPGGSRKAVHVAVSEGRISAFGPDKLIDPILADSQWERNTRARTATASSRQQPLNNIGDDSGSPDEPPTQNKPAQDPGYMQFRAKREEAEAEIAVLNAAKMRGTLLQREDIDRAMFEIGREIRDTLSSCARRIASEVVSTNSAEACEKIIEREHRIVLELLVTSFREKVGATAGGSK